MERKLPESSILSPPHNVESPMKDAKESFYNLAKNKIRYLSSKEIIQWNEEQRGAENYLTNASFLIKYGGVTSREGLVLAKWIENLEIVVNKNAFKIYGEDYSDLIPFVLEHEIYEAWLSAKKGFGQRLNEAQKHLLATRKAYLLAEQQGLGKKLFEYDMKINSSKKEEYEYALQSARKTLRETNRS